MESFRQFLIQLKNSRSFYYEKVISWFLDNVEDMPAEQFEVLDDWHPLQYLDSALDDQDLFCYLKLVPFQFRRKYKIMFGPALPFMGLFRVLIKRFKHVHSHSFTLQYQGLQLINPQFPVEFHIYHLNRQYNEKSLYQQYLERPNSSGMLGANNFQYDPNYWFRDSQYEEWVSDLFHSELQPGFCYLALIPEFFREAAALEFGEYPEWNLCMEEIFDLYYDNGMNDFVNHLTNQVHFCEVQVHMHQTMPFGHHIYVHVQNSSFSIQIQDRNIRSRSVPISFFFRTNENSLVGLYPFPLFERIYIGAEQGRIRRPMVNLAQTLITELKETGMSKDTNINKIFSKITQGIHDSAINFPYQVNDHDFQLLNAELNGILIPTNRKRKSHGVVKFIDYYYKMQIAQSFNKGDVVIFLGAKLREVVDALIVEPSIEPIVIYGERDAEDKTRREENMRFAQRFLDRVKDGKGKYYGFDGLLDKYIIDYDQIQNKICKVLENYLFYYNGKRNDYHYKVSQVKKLRCKANIMQITNSVYDITPQEVAFYMRKFNVQFAYFSRISCADLIGLGYSINEALGVEFRQIGDKVAMTFLRDSSKGYVHQVDNIKAWNLYTKYRTNNGLLYYELNDEIFNYELAVLSIADLPDLDRIVYKPVLYSSYVRLFKVGPYLKYNKIEYFFVDRRKFDRILDYAGRVSADSFDPTKLMTMATSIKNTIRVGEATVQHAWEVDQITFYETIMFCILFSSLRKGEMIETIIESIDLSKKGGYHPWFTNTILSSFKRYLTGVWEPAKMLKKFEAVMRAPDSLYWEPGCKYDISGKITAIFNKIRYGELHSDHDHHNMAIMFKDMEEQVIYNRIFKLANEMLDLTKKILDFYFRCVRLGIKLWTYPVWKPVEVLYKFLDNRYGFSEYFNKVYDGIYRVEQYLLKRTASLYVSVRQMIIQELYPDQYSDTDTVSTRTQERTLRWLDALETDNLSILESESYHTETTSETIFSSSDGSSKSSSTESSYDDDDSFQQPLTTNNNEIDDLFEKIDETIQSFDSNQSKKKDTLTVSFSDIVKIGSTSNVSKQPKSAMGQYAFKNEQYWTPKNIAEKFFSFVNGERTITSSTTILDACAGYGALSAVFRQITARILAVELDSQVQWHPDFLKTVTFEFRDIRSLEDFNYDVVISNPPFGANQDNQPTARKIFFKLFDNFPRSLAIIQQPSQVEYIIENFLNRDDYDYVKSEIIQFPIYRTYEHHKSPVKYIPVQFLYISRKTSLFDLKGKRSGKRSGRAITGQKKYKPSKNSLQFQNIPFGRQKNF